MLRALTLIAFLSMPQQLPLGGIPIGAAVTFTHIQGGSDFSGAGPPETATSCHPSLGSTSTVGNIVWVALIAVLPTASTAPGSLTVQDANSNAYTLTASSGTAYNPTGSFWFHVYLAYFIVSGTPSKTINIAWTGTFRAECWADEFHKSTGSITYVTDAANSLSVCSGTSAATPSVNPSGTPGLLYSVGFDFDNGLVAPTSGASLGSWIGAAGGVELADLGGAAEYDLAASGSTAVNYTCGASADHYGAMVGAAH